MESYQQFFLGADQAPILARKSDGSVFRVTSGREMEFGIYKQVFETKQFIILNENSKGDSLLLRHSDGARLHLFEQARICQLSADESHILYTARSQIHLMCLSQAREIVACKPFASTGRRMRAGRYNRLIIITPFCREEIFGIENYFAVTSSIEFHSQANGEMNECLKIKITTKDGASQTFYYELHSGELLGTESYSSPEASYSEK